MYDPECAKFYKNKCDAFGGLKAAWTWQQAELEDLLRQCITIADAGRKPITIYVDALDKAGQEYAPRTAQYFHEITEEVTTLKVQAKICISCRHYPVLSSVPKYEICVEDHNSHDIAALARDRLDSQRFEDISRSDMEGLERLRTYVLSSTRRAYLYGCTWSWPSLKSGLEMEYRLTKYDAGWRRRSPGVWTKYIVHPIKRYFKRGLCPILFYFPVHLRGI